MQHWGLREKIGWLGIRIMRHSGTTGLHKDCCFSEQVLSKFCWSSPKMTSKSSSHLNPIYCWLVLAYILWYCVTVRSSSSFASMIGLEPVVPLWRIILIPSQPIFSLNPQCCMLSTEAANTNFIVFGLTRPDSKPW
jgi:hypothetical protein